MSTHRRRKRELSAARQDGLDRAIDALAWDGGEQLEQEVAEIERIEDWDRRFPTGEGSVVERVRRLVDGRYQWVDDPCTYQWVRVANDRGKVLGTFYLRHHDGEVLELWIAPARKGVAPNPRDRSSMSLVAWRKRDAEIAREWREEQDRRAAMTPAEREQHMAVEMERARELLEFNRQRYGDDFQDWESYQREVERIRRSWDGTVNRETRPWSTDDRAILGSTGLAEAHKVKGQRPTTGVQPTTALHGDVRFTFRDGGNSFSVAGSKLGPVLLGYRRAGYQKVTLQMVRLAVDHMAQTGKVKP